MTGPATPDPTPYTVWIDYGSEGWSPHECATVADCLDAICQYSGQGYRITRTVTLIDPDATPTPDPPTALGGEHTTTQRLTVPRGEHTTTLGCTVSVWPSSAASEVGPCGAFLTFDLDQRHAAEVLLSAADRAAIRELLR